MESILIRNATIVNEGESFTGSILIEGRIIKSIHKSDDSPALPAAKHIVDAKGKLLLPGAIDSHVHFREPGLTHKGSIATEAAAAVAGGVTTFMDMPNTTPHTVTLELLEQKLRRAEETSPANYSFFVGATNDNLAELSRLDPTRVPGIKLFLGSSTGNMLVDNPETLRRLFRETSLLIAAHAEKESLIRQNITRYVALGRPLSIDLHPLIRSAEACYAASAEAVELSLLTGTRLHLLHLSTAQELGLLKEGPVGDKQITAEVTVSHLHFSSGDYPLLGNRIKINPAIKSTADRRALRQALLKGKLDVISTDHAPHLLSEKEGDCLSAASGAPMIQHSLLLMLEMVDRGLYTYPQIVSFISHRPADLYRIDRRGYIRPGYYADIVLISPHTQPQTVTKDSLLYKCGWSPLEGHTFYNAVYQTYVNGALAYDRGRLLPHAGGMEVRYLR